MHVVSMPRLTAIILLGYMATMPGFAAMVVTRSERITGKILSDTESAVTIKPDEGKTQVISRAAILQVFGDGGELIWQAELPKETAKPETPQIIAQPNFPKRAIIADFMIGGVLGGYYTEENRVISATNIVAKYSDGSVQSAQTTSMTLGGGIGYQWYSSARWSSLVSYFYRSTAQTVFTGDGRSYEKINLAEERVSAIHTLMYGKEAHFYPTAEEVSFDLIGQAGYELGTYNALGTYRSLYGRLTPSPALYSGATNIIFHGPALRLGAGVTFRGSAWLFRVTGFFQTAAVFGSDKVDFSSGGVNIASTNTVNLLHDYYASAALGFSF